MKIIENEFYTAVKSEEKADYKTKADHCELCNGKEIRIFGFWIESTTCFNSQKNYLRADDLWGGLHLRINYCPLCGRKLNNVY
ncbi:MAG TPA: hypothetical protein GX519_07875 [Thermoanaerobacterales bacterium]|nr:hypothetical protein [Thermoanaerobacterales bacterium]